MPRLEVVNLSQLCFISEFSVFQANPTQPAACDRSPTPPLRRGAEKDFFQKMFLCFLLV